MPSRNASIFFAAVLAGLATVSVAVQAQSPSAAIPKPPIAPNEREVVLVRQDQSDCTNTNVPSADSPNVGGILAVVRGTDGNTTVKVAMTASPDTTYHFYLKCVRQLGDIKTGDEGSGNAVFVFPTASVGATFAFDMYPEGAPPGNKFQSATVSY
jgi:hypothetical protein